MQIRKPKALADGRYDCEVKHPEFGWIPLTAAADDPDTQEIHAEIANGKGGQVEPPPTPTEAAEAALAIERDMMNPSRLQCRLAMLEFGVLDQAEAAVAAADRATQEAWGAAQYFRRNSPLVLGMIAGLGWTEELTDQMFRYALTIEA